MNSKGGNESNLYTMEYKQKIKLLIFDLDGTLVDTLPGIASALRHVMTELECEKLGCQMPSDEFVRMNIGGGAKNLLQKAFGDKSDLLLPKALPFYSAYYAQNAAADSSLYPGVAETLAYFAKKFRMAVFTAKARAATLLVLESFDILKYFDVVVTSDDVQKLKPDPEGAEKILAAIGESPSKAMMVGDTHADVAAAKNAGIVSCAVTYGYGAERILHENLYDCVVDRFESLREIV